MSWSPESKPVREPGDQSPGLGTQESGVAEERTNGGEGQALARGRPKRQSCDWGVRVAHSTAEAGEVEPETTRWREGANR